MSRGSYQNVSSAREMRPAMKGVLVTLTLLKPDLSKFRDILDNSSRNYARRFFFSDYLSSLWARGRVVG
jgi:hypothetical protein